MASPCRVSGLVMSEVRVRSQTMGRLGGGASSPPARREWLGGREGFEWQGQWVGRREGLLEGGRRPGQEREGQRGVRELDGRSKTNMREGQGGRAHSHTREWRSREWQVRDINLLVLPQLGKQICV